VVNTSFEVNPESFEIDRKVVQNIDDTFKTVS